MLHGKLVGTVDKDKVTKDEVLAMIIIGKLPEQVSKSGDGRAHHLRVEIGEGLEVVIGPGARLAEGPLWDARSGRLGWIDVLSSQVLLTDIATGQTEVIEVPSHVGAIAPRAAGGFVAALQDGFWVVGDGPTRRITSVAEARPSLRFNDGKCDPAGRFWAGTMAYDETPGAGALYRLDPDGGASLMLDGVTISNGLAWSLDGRTMYYIDTPTRRIDAFSFTRQRARSATGGR